MTVDQTRNGFRPARLPPGGPKKTREHVVPQWLQRGFSLSPDTKRPQVAVYRKNGAPLWTSTVNVGVRKSFFTSAYYDGDKTVTDLDGEFASVVEDLRERSGALGGDDARSAARLFGHLEVRQGATERTIRTMWTNVMLTTVRVLRARDDVQAWLGKPMVSYGPGAGGIGRRCTKRLRRAWGRRRRQPIYVGEMIRMALATIGSFKALLAAEVGVNGDSVREVVKDYGDRLAQGDVLEDAIIFNRSKEMFLRGEARSRVATYAAFDWRVVHFPEDLILPDSMVFHEVTDSPLAQNFLHVLERHVASYLPMSSRMALVGRSRRRKGWPATAARLRFRAAQASFDFFVAAERNPGYQNLSAVIGTHRGFATARDWQVVTEECLAE